MKPEVDVVRTFVADDSIVMRRLVRRVLEEDPRISVCGEARDGVDLLEKVWSAGTEVLVLDVEMPRMDGLTALKTIMATNPIPTVMFSSKTTRSAQVTFQALSLGAVDFVPKPDSKCDLSSVAKDLCNKVVTAKGARLQREPAAQLSVPKVRTGSVKPPSSLIVIGCSTGGPRALEEILPALSSSLTAAVLVCQHMPYGFTASMARRLDSVCRLPVSEAFDGQELRAGQITIAPGGMQTRLVRRSGGVVINLEPASSSFNPLPVIDIVVADAAPMFRESFMTVILTGMGSDGTRGARIAKMSGGRVVCQDESRAVVWGMPRACIESGNCDKISPLEKIADEIGEFAARSEVNRQKALGMESSGPALVYGLGSQSIWR